MIFDSFLVNTRSKAPSYKDGINALATNDNFLLDVISGDAENNSYGGKKFGLGLNIEQELTDEIGFFSRIGWNDGKYASWAFTEIDQTFTAGLSVKGNWWKRDEDIFGIAFANNGISSGHRNFLKEGGYGFIIGDGKLNYGHETIIESYYNAKLLKFLWLSFDYQFVKNPGIQQGQGTCACLRITRECIPLEINKIYQENISLTLSKKLFSLLSG